MTPLAQHMLNDYCSPIKDRTIADPHKALRHLVDAKCFDVSELETFIGDEKLIGREPSDLMRSGRVFLPARVTFIDLLGHKMGFMLVAINDDWFDLYFCSRIAVVHVCQVTTSVGYKKHSCIAVYADALKAAPTTHVQVVLATLFLINTPNLLGAITHLPHAGLQRKLAAAKGMTGKFPLQAWTEITLRVDPFGMPEPLHAAIREARLSGSKCLHFVRAFLRWRRGRLEYVRWHWRGDASIGIKRSRYRVLPKKPSPPGARP